MVGPGAGVARDRQQEATEQSSTESDRVRVDYYGFTVSRADARESG